MDMDFHLKPIPLNIRDAKIYSKLCKILIYNSEFNGNGESTLSTLSTLNLLKLKNKTNELKIYKKLLKQTEFINFEHVIFYIKKRKNFNNFIEELKELYHITFQGALCYT